MGILDKIIRPTAAKLADQIGELGRQIADLEFRRAEGESIADELLASGDDRYAAKAAEVKALRIDLADCRERMDRLTRIHADQREREKAAHIARLRGQLDKARNVYARRVREAGAEVQAETVRHEDELRAIEYRTAMVHREIGRFEKQIKLAESGVCEADIATLEDLLDRRREITESLNKRGVPERIRRLRADIDNLSVESRCTAHPIALVEQMQRDIKAKRAELEPLEDEAALAQAESATLTREINRIRGT